MPMRVEHVRQNGSAEAVVSLQGEDTQAHKRAVCLVKEGKGEKGIVVVDDLEGDAVPE
jgi:hypothetical protein